MYRLLEELCLERGMMLEEVINVIDLSDEELQSIDCIESRLDSLELALCNEEDELC